MGKYAPLTRFLREQEAPRVDLRFSELEEILGFSLPGSAYKYASWWANSATGQSQVKGWRDAGWETRDVDLSGRRVSFVRVRGEPVASPSPDRKPQEAPAPAPSIASRERNAAPAAVKPLPAGAIDPARLPPGMRRLLEARAQRNGRKLADEVAAILQQAAAEERAMLVEELAQMRGRTQRAGAFGLLDVLGR